MSTFNQSCPQSYTAPTLRPVEILTERMVMGSPVTIPEYPSVEIYEEDF